MLKNYIVVALRSIRKQKGLAVINVFGLGCGIALCLLIMLFNRDELTYDRFHDDHESIHRVERFYYDADRGFRSNSINDNLMLPTALKADIPEVRAASIFFNRTSYLQINQERSQESTEENILFAGAEFLDVFSFKLMQGDPASALRDPKNIILSAAAAKKHFGDANPVGEVVQILVAGEYRDFVVSAIAENHPENSTIKFDAIARYERYVDLDQELQPLKDSWSLNYAA